MCSVMTGTKGGEGPSGHQTFTSRIGLSPSSPHPPHLGDWRFHPAGFDGRSKSCCLHWRSDKLTMSLANPSLRFISSSDSSVSSSDPFTNYEDPSHVAFQRYLPLVQR